MNNLLAKQAALQDKLDACDAWNLDARLELAMAALCCPPRETVGAALSPGEKRGEWPCVVFSLRNRTYFSSMSPLTTWMPRRFVGWNDTSGSTRGRLIAVTHDRYFLDNVAGWILELDRGRGDTLQGQLHAIGSRPGQNGLP